MVLEYFNFGIFSHSEVPESVGFDLEGIRKKARVRLKPRFLVSKTQFFINSLLKTIGRKK